MRQILPLALFVLLAACVNPGQVRLGAPRVHDSPTTRALLKSGGALIAKDVRAADPAAIQEFMAAQELTALTARAAAAGAPSAGGPAPVPALPEAAGAGAMPALPPADLAFGRTIPEQANDLRHREARAAEVELLYDGRGNASFLGPDARVYLVSFEIGIFPTRQSRLLYPVYWLQSAFLDDYNFTKEWFTSVSFEIPLLDGEKELDPLVSIYEVLPRYDVLTAREAASSAQQLQLIAAGGGEGAAGQIDYLRRLEEQFAEQRRYPLQLGMIEYEKAWSWTFGTRRQLERRSPLVSWIPFVGKYRAQSHLEPGMRTGHAILLIPNYKRFLARHDCSSLLVAEDAQQREPVGVSEYRGTNRGQAKEAVSALWKTARDASHDAAKIDASGGCAEGKIRLPVVVRASYLKLDQPGRRIPIPITGSPAGHQFARLVDLTLDLDPDPKDVKRGAARVANLKPAEKDRALVTIKVDGAQQPSLTTVRVRSVEVRDETRKRPLQIASPEVFDDETITALIEMPSEPQGAAIDLAARVVTTKADYRSDPAIFLAYKGPWHSTPAGSVNMAPNSGGTGALIRFDISQELRTDPKLPVDASKVAKVFFGTAPVSRGENGWQVAPGKDGFSFLRLLRRRAPAWWTSSFSSTTEGPRFEREASRIVEDGIRVGAP